MGRGGRRIGAGRKPANLIAFEPRGGISRGQTGPESDLDEGCPEELRDPVSRAEWERVIVPAIRMGQITAADRCLAIAHCELWGQRLSQLREAQAQPAVVAVGRNRYPIPNPALTMAATTLKLLLKIDAELGLSPKGRSRVLKARGLARRSASLDRTRKKFFDLDGG